MSIIQTLADAITRQEGSTKPGTRGYRNNNPGNLRDVWTNDRWYIWPDLPHDDQGFPVFPSPAAGRAALEHDLQLKIDRGLSLRELIYAWAPPSENRTEVYLQNVADWTGLPLDEALFAYSGGVEQSEFSTSTAGIIIGIVVAAYVLS